MVVGTHYITDVYGNEKPQYLVVAFLATLLVLLHGLSIYFKAVKKAEQELEGQPSLYIPPDPRPSLALGGQSPALGRDADQRQAYQYESQIEPPERY